MNVHGTLWVSATQTQAFLRVRRYPGLVAEMFYTAPDLL